MGGTVTQRMQIVEILVDTGWTYGEYRDQPQWVIDHLIARTTGRQRVDNFNKRKHG